LRAIDVVGYWKPRENEEKETRAVLNAERRMRGGETDVEDDICAPVSECGYRSGVLFLNAYVTGCNYKRHLAQFHQKLIFILKLIHQGGSCCGSNKKLYWVLLLQNVEGHALVIGYIPSTANKVLHEHVRSIWLQI
jgi:hypothetical protein